MLTGLAHNESRSEASVGIPSLLRWNLFRHVKKNGKINENVGFKITKTNSLLWIYPNQVINQINADF